MKSYKVIVIDDEQLAIDVILNYLGRYPKYHVVESFLNPEKAFAYMLENKIDLVISDIAMPGLSGLELAKLESKKTAFIMVTSYSEFAIKSFELNVCDYLLKPISFERFAQSLLRFEDGFSKENKEIESFFIKEGDAYKKISIQDIDVIIGMKDYAKIHCGDRQYLFLKTLTSIERFLAPFNFIRIHKSYIVPLNKIDHFDGKYLRINQQDYPVGSSYKNRLKDLLDQKRI